MPCSHLQTKRQRLALPSHQHLSITESPNQLVLRSAAGHGGERMKSKPQL